MNITFDDVRIFRRCPYAYRLDKTDAFPDKYTLLECLVRSVNDTVDSFSRPRILGHRIREDDVKNAFWNNWDECFRKVYNPLKEDPMQYIRLGERCAKNFAWQCTRFGSSAVLASHMGGVQKLPGGQDIAVDIQELDGDGNTAFVTKYIVDAEVMSRESLMKDYEMKVSALWALENLGASKVVMRWVFLVQNVTTELNADRYECLDAAAITASVLEDMRSPKDPLPRESAYCGSCPYQSRCPRFLHELSVKDMDSDEGVKLVDSYIEIEEKMTALRNRLALLDAEQDAIKAKLVAYADSKGFMSLKGHNGKLLVRHERKVDLPSDKTALIARLKETGEYDSLSMPNYPRLRSDIAKGKADPEVTAMATISEIDRIYYKKRFIRPCRTW